MIAILSPAKTLDFETHYDVSKFTIPKFLSQSEELIKVLQKYDTPEISNLMGISESLSELNYTRYQSWTKDINLSNSKQAILCFKGGVYVGLDVGSFSDADLTYSQDYLRILSGLHGVLQPLDLIQAHRLEMGTKLETKKGKNLYEFWGKRITQALNASLEDCNSTQNLNLASNEYISSIMPHKIQGNIIDVKFLEYKNNTYKTISFFAKKARGAMASFLIKNKIKNINDLKSFTDLGYSFDPTKSNKDLLVFIR